MQLPAAEDEQQEFDDEELQKLIATPVQWKAGKNLTVTKKHKKFKQTRTVTKNEPQPPFFALFDAVEVPTDEQMEVHRAPAASPMIFYVLPANGGRGTGSCQGQDADALRLWLLY